MTTPTLTPRAARELAAFRLMLDGTARPGSIAEIEPHESGGPVAVAVALLEALLDHEVTFAVVPQDAATEETLLRLTGSHLATPESADYVVAHGEGVGEALRVAKEGEFDYPDRSATVIAVVDAVGVRGIGEELVLAGPGIRTTEHLWLAGPIDDLLAVRAERNQQLPLGIDIVLVDRAGRAACLPRYTRIERGA